MPRSAPLQAARDRIAAEGGRLGGQAPYGWRWAGAGGGRLTPVRDEQAVRFLTLHLRRRGLGPQAIADELNRLGLPMRNGKPWDRRYVHRIVRTPEPLEATG